MLMYFFGSGTTLGIWADLKTAAVSEEHAHCTALQLGQADLCNVYLTLPTAWHDTLSGESLCYYSAFHPEVS